MRTPRRPARQFAAACLIGALSLAGCGDTGTEDPAGTADAADHTADAADHTADAADHTGEPGGDRITVEASGMLLDLTVPEGVDPQVREVKENSNCGGEIAEVAHWVVPQGATDHRPRFAVLTAEPGTACPERDPLNGVLPAWGSVEELPDGAEPLELDTDFASVHTFTVDYTQCTNECYDRTYEVFFVDVDVDVDVDGNGAHAFAVYTLDLADGQGEDLVRSITLQD